MDFGRIINKHSVQFAYPTQVNSLMTQIALLHMTAAACCFACMDVEASVLCIRRSSMASEHLVRPLFSLQYSKLTKSGQPQLSTEVAQAIYWPMHECTPPSTVI